MSSGAGGRGTVAVLGPGGVGGLLAALLARSGRDVVCLAGEETARRLGESGIAVTSERFGDFRARVRAPAELAEPVRACLVTVKATALEPALTRVAPAVLGDALLVPLLNGIEHVDVLRERYPAATVVAGTIRVESTRVEPGRVEHSSPFASVELAATGASLPPAERLAHALRGAGLDVHIRDDEDAMLWDKLSFLAPLALATTHAGEPAGPVRSERRDVLLALVDEVAAVAAADGAPIDRGAVVEFVDGVPASMRSSMLRDADAGRALEVEAIGGVILRRAERAGIAVPVAARLVGELRDRDAAR